MSYVGELGRSGERRDVMVMMASTMGYLKVASTLYVLLMSVAKSSCCVATTPTASNRHSPSRSQATCHMPIWDIGFPELSSRYNVT